MNLNATIIGQTISFIIFVLFCMKYIWPPLISVIERRQKEIADNLMYARDSKNKSDEMLILAQNKLQQSTNEAQKIIRQANEYKNVIISEAKIQGELELNKIISQAKKELSLERDRVYKELYSEIHELIIFGVKKIITNSMNKEVDHRIIDNIINKLNIKSNG